MARLSERDLAAVEELEAEVMSIRLGGGGGWGPVLQQLGRALRAPVPMVYGVRATDEGPRLAFLEVSAAAVGHSPSGLERRRATRGPRSPPEQPWPDLGLPHHDRIRVPICEGPVLAAWVGACRPALAPFTVRERMMLQRLAPALRRRLLLERRLTEVPLARAALEACLEALPRPAMIVDGAGRIHWANAPARRLAATDASSLARRLRESLQSGRAGFELSPVRAPALGPHHLAVEAPRTTDPEQLLGSAAARWSLTPRERQVLRHLAEGHSNRGVAALLRCGPRTVESHVARLLRKSGCQSRTQLIARYWSDLPPEDPSRPPHAPA